jgi:hypothetical protein
MYPQLHCGFYLYNNKIYVSRIDLLDDMLLNVELREKSFSIPHDISISAIWLLIALMSQSSN